jgi:hypothetical protein
VPAAKIRKFAMREVPAPKGAAVPPKTIAEGAILRGALASAMPR